MLKWRLISASVIIAITLVLVCLDFNCNFGRPGIWLIPLGLAVSLLAVAEMLDMLRSNNLRPLAWTVYFGTSLIIAASAVPLLWESYPGDFPMAKLGWPLAAFALAMVMVWIGEIRRYRRAGEAIVNAALAIYTLAYVGLLMSFLIALRLFRDNEWGMLAILSTIIIVKISDSSAFAVGKLIGRRKLSPLLSPGKTVEGAVGGLVGGCLAAWLVFWLLMPWLFDEPVVAPAWWRVLAYGLVVTLAGMLGDLAESLLKRDMQSKDSSRWLPGLGGVLDIVDSVLVAGPAAYLCWAGGLVGPGGS